MTVPVQRLVAAIDLGSSKVTGIIGEVTGDARSWGLRVLGIGIEETTAIRRGTIRDFEGTVRSITRAVKAAGGRIFMQRLGQSGGRGWKRRLPDG